jgi:uncharacterized protein with NAD-binding domain and iron-sulfur cluster
VNGPSHRTKVAVLGGGAGGMTAAWELTATPDLRERFDVTVYQLGWRLGGKGASGRNAASGDRIEEHGLHVWFGFYDNAFRLMRDAYEELGRDPAAPLARFEDAFKPCDQLVLYDRQAGRWHPFVFNPPPNFLSPGDPGELPSFWEMAAAACRWALGRFRDVRETRPGLAGAAPPSRFTPAWFGELAAEIGGELLELELEGAGHLMELAERLAQVRARHTDHLQAEQAGHPFLLAKLLGGFRDWLWAVARDRIDDDPDLRLFFTMVDAIAATAVGIVQDGVLERGFDAVDDQEWAAWLRRHGAHEVTLGRTPAERSPVLRSVYDVAFGYPGGDIDKANVAAGTATNDLLRLLFSYRGSLMYKMQAGMGDVVFTPLYEVLRRRGVRFEFFHAVTRLEPAPGADRIESVHIVPQVQLVDGEYRPLVDVKGLECWPSEPLWDQLVDGERLRREGVNFELEENPLGREPQTLRRGADFDQLVLAIPVGALAPICAELTQRDEGLRAAIETAVTVPTQAFQLWARRESEELGWAHRTNSVAGCYVEPLDTWCDMSHLIPRESWTGADDVRAIAYVCGVLEERDESPAQATARVREAALEFMERDIGTLWPRFGWDDLADAAGRSGRKRFEAQYWRANVTPSERYVLTPAGSVAHRLRSDEAAFENLVLAGDWTSNGVNGGCVEAAVISGMQAADALTGIRRPIAGESPRWLRPQPQDLPPYVEYGGRATAPPEFLSLGGRLLGFMLRGDQARIRDLVDRMLSGPAGDGVDYRALGSRILLLLGGFQRVSSTTSPFDRWGTVEEIQASFWVPVVAGRRLGDVFVGERVGLAVPYIFVDNPMSYLGGRETYGYAKTMARFDPPEGVGETVRMETFGGNFGRDEAAGWRPFLELAAVEELSDRAREEIDAPDEVARFLADDPLRLDAGGRLAVADIRLAEDVVEDLLRLRVRQVFLKQFRDAGDGTRACYQAVVEAPIEVKRFSVRPSGFDWDLTIHPLDSHPIEQELGLGSQRPLMAFEAELDMIVERGVEIGRVAAAPAAPPVAREAAARVDGLPAMLESAARWILREMGALERASLGRLRRR